MPAMFVALPPFSTQTPATAWQPALAHQCGLGESPYWCTARQELVWADIPGCELLAWSASGGLRRWAVPSNPGCVVPTSQGGYAIGLRDGVYTAAHWGGPLRKRWAFEVPAGVDPKSLRLNDGKADLQGRFWVGSYSERREATAQLFCLQASGEGFAVVHEESGFAASNGLAFGSNLMSWANTAAHALELRHCNPAKKATLQFNPKPAGWESAADPAHQHYQGRPDGACMDSQGCVWVALFEGGAVIRVSPAGQVLERIQTPCLKPTMPCLGGEDLRTLFITSAQNPGEPLGGSVWQVCVSVAGLPVGLVSTNF